MTDDLFIRRTAEFSPCRTFRYTLGRYWDTERPQVTFVLLNPSTADAEKDDPTNRRGIQYAIDWGFGSVVFCNLFAFRTPHPKEMKKAEDPVGPLNDFWILKEAQKAEKVVLAWGASGSFRRRDLEVLTLLREAEIPLWHIWLTQADHPGHILYLAKYLKPKPFEKEKA